MSQTNASVVVGKWGKFYILTLFCCIKQSLCLYIHIHLHSGVRGLYMIHLSNQTRPDQTIHTLMTQHQGKYLSQGCFNMQCCPQSHSLHWTFPNCYTPLITWPLNSVTRDARIVKFWASADVDVVNVFLFLCYLLLFCVEDGEILPHNQHFHSVDFKDSKMDR